MINESQAEPAVFQLKTSAKLQEMRRAERECLEGVATRSLDARGLLTVQRDDGGAMLIFP